jgi:DHA2 family multidrug resistance protein
MSAADPSAGPPGDQALVVMPAAQRILAQGLIMAATSLIILDQTIATVALPHMQAALGATPDTVSWVLTSYILAAAVAIPMTAWLTGRVGRRRVFSGAVLIFTISSATCALAVSLPMMVIARFIQGYSGAFLIPLSQSFMLDINRPSRQMRALTIWGLGIMVAPILGPIVGGWLTQSMDWRWIFMINVPTGLIAFVGILLTIPEVPTPRRSFDHVGFLMIAVGLCSLQLLLDRGTQQDWFDSPEIIIETGLCIGALWMLVFHLRRAAHPIITLELFHDRNYLAAIIIGFVINPITVTSAAMLPQFMQMMLHYPVMMAGMLIIPRGITVTLAMVIGPRLLRRFDGRIVLFFGLCMITLSLWLQTRFTLDMDMSLIIWSGLAQGIGVGFAIATGNMLSMANLPVRLRTEGAAIYMLARNLGTSVLIAVMSALLAHNVQINHQEVGSALRANAMPLLLPGIADRLAAPSGMIGELADLEVNRQSMMISYLDDFWLMMWMTIGFMPLVFFLRRPAATKGETVLIAD